ncbi:MAG: hypothetical protein RR585_12235 [Coprobacillus sp.]
MRLYFADGHYEIVNKQVRNYLIKRDDQGYKKPILIYAGYLHPTKNRCDMSCKWVNLEYFIQNHYLFITLLKQKGLYEKTKKMTFDIFFG